MYSIKAAAQATGLTVETLRAWERRYAAVVPIRDRAGRRTYRPDDLVRLRRLRDAAAQGHRIGDLVRLSNDQLTELLAGIAALAGPPADSNAFVERVLSAAARYRANACEQPLTMAVALLPPLQLIGDVLHPLLREVGERWHRGEFSIAQERLISAGVRRHLSAALDAYARNARGAGMVFATLAGERHDLGLMMCATLCASRGHAIHFLGADLPAAEIGRYARNVSAQVVALSVVMSEGLDEVPGQLKLLSDAAGVDCPIWLGGPAVVRLRAAALPGACVVVPDPALLERQLNRLESTLPALSV